eukprot:CAMPEP_0173303982 /NCGR_PEP_ID=MMETSP1143-20121109/19191_1 /TAXON_ID=483371 /ORGANISM="non described non described, Strain CCMP2298" /LENGTH=114 /DNA_ID=CAMNT_0014244751 /DNA_START=1044 /DNA_END=1388 /DNA_ORIENTATION=-
MELRTLRRMREVGRVSMQSNQSVEVYRTGPLIAPKAVLRKDLRVVCVSVCAGFCVCTCAPPSGLNTPPEPRMSMRFTTRDGVERSLNASHDASSSTTTTVALPIPDALCALMGR